MSHNALPQALAVVGPTASGKSDIAIALAKTFDGEIISCDSRQIYRGMDKGTGKVVRDEQRKSENEEGNTKKEKSVPTPEKFFSEKIRHHMIDIANPNTPYNVAKFQKRANAIIKDICKRGKLPILCGGTGLWAQTVVENMSFPAVLPDKKLRAELGALDTETLFHKLHSIHPERARTIDPKNRHRLIRAIEIARGTEKGEGKRKKGESQETDNSTKKTISLSWVAPTSKSPAPSSVDWIVLAVDPPRDILFAKIEKRLDERLADGMIDEVARLHREHNVSWTRLDAFGLEYRWISRFLRNELSYETMREKLLFDIRHYAKRQLTWIRRWEKSGRRILRISSPTEAEKELRAFLRA